MKQAELAVLALAGIAVYMIVQVSKKQSAATGGSYTFGSQAPGLNFAGFNLGTGWQALSGAGGVTVSPSGNLTMPSATFGVSGSW